MPQTRLWRLLGGALSGFFGGLVGNQGGLRAAALLGANLRPRQLVATATASALLVDAARVPIYLLSAGPVIVGVPILSRIPTSIYRRLVGGLLLLLGISLIAVATF